MARKILVNAVHPEECRVAIVEDGRLQDIHVETGSKEHTKGNIYKGIITKVEPGLQAAFVDFGHAKHGFLQFREIQGKYFKKKGKQEDAQNGKSRIQDVLSKGQELLVQVEKEQRDLKGASLTTYVSLAGRYMVAMPGHGNLGISRKIEGDKEREKIREVVQNLNTPEDMGLIVRTAAAGETKASLSRDLKYLLNLWETIEKTAAKAKAPALIHKEEDIVIRAIRDYLTSDVEEVLIDQPDTYKNAREFFRTYQPKYQRMIKLYRGRHPLFAFHGLEEQIEEIHHRRVPLPSGGSIVIDTGEALTAIDVNSGKTHGEKDIEALALHTNLEAVKEIARQLRLRDLGGLIVIDLIDMRPVKNNREVEKALKQALKKDKAHTDTTRISQFGLLELSRERLRPSFRDIHYVPCAVCDGTGYVKSDEHLALFGLRKLQAAAAADETITALTCRLPVGAANYVLNRKRESLNRFVTTFGFAPEILGDFSLPSGRLVVEIRRDGESVSEIVTNASDQEGVRKKRRKRKKKKRTAPGETAEAIEMHAGEGEGPGGEEPGAEQPPSQPEAEDGAPAKKTTRRRRRRKKKPEASGQKPSTDGVAEEGEPSAEAVAPAPAPASADDGLAAVTDKQPLKSPRRRARRKKSPSAAKEQAPETTPESPVTTAEPKAAEAAEAAEAGEATEPRKRTRRRPSRTRKTAASPAASATEKDTGGEAPPSGGKGAETRGAKTPEGDAEGKPPARKKARRRTPRRTASTKKAEASEAATDAASPSGDTTD